MLRRPIESKNIGPYRKLLSSVSDDSFFNGVELNKKSIDNIVTKLESKTAEQKKEIFSTINITESEYKKLIEFLKICSSFIELPLPDLALPENIYKYKDTYRSVARTPFERVVKYENFTINLVLNSYKDNIVVRDNIRNDLDNDIIIKGATDDDFIIIKKQDTLNNRLGDFITLQEPFVVCHLCESIENSMLKNNFYELENDYHSIGNNDSRVLKNGWRFSQNQNAGAQNFFYDTLLDPFLHELRVDETRNTYWCSYCGSLVFTRLFSKLNSSSIEIGISSFIGEDIPKKVTIQFPQNFVLYSPSNSISELGELMIYSNGYQSYRIIRETSTNMNIVNIQNQKIGTIVFNVSTRVMNINFTYDKKLDDGTIQVIDEIRQKLNATINNSDLKNTTFLIELRKDAFLTEQINNIEEYEIIKSTITFDNNDFKDFVGCIIGNDVLSAPTKLSPKRVTFSELRKHNFERLGIDLMLFYTFKD